MFKILLMFVAALAATNGDAVSRMTRSYTSSYTVYTNDNPRTGQTVVATVASVNSLRITSATNCAILIHGMNGGANDAMSLVVRDALLASGTINVIVVDWSTSAIGSNAVNAIQAIGANVAELVRILSTQNRINRARLHLIGFDMGAHIAGVAGSVFNDVARITGLNPYGDNSWNWISATYRLKATDAYYVEVIHTETSEFGIPAPLGDVDFYPNGAVNQPGCEDTLCSHNRAWELFAASLTDGGLVGHRCNSVDDAMSTTQPCRGFRLTMGTTDVIKYGSGYFQLETEPVYPYRCYFKCGLIDTVIDAIEGLAGSSTDNGDDGSGDNDNRTPFSLE